MFQYIVLRMILFPLDSADAVQILFAVFQIVIDKAHAVHFLLGELLCELAEQSVKRCIIVVFSAVVYALAQHDLSVHQNARRIQPIHLSKRLSGEPVIQHFTAQRRIHGLKGDIDG